MKKLNKKGFTLIELLAIIVILAIIMVLTIPTVLNSLQSARQNSLETAVATIEKYMQDTLDACEINDNDLASCDGTVYEAITGVAVGGVLPDSATFTDEENATDGKKAVIIPAAGYSVKDITYIQYKYTKAGNKVQIIAAKSDAAGKFKGAEFK